MMRKLEIGGSKVLEAGKLNVIVTGKLYDKDGNLYPKLIIDSMTEIRDFKGDKYNE